MKFESKSFYRCLPATIALLARQIFRGSMGGHSASYAVSASTRTSPLGAGRPIWRRSRSSRTAFSLVFRRFRGFSPSFTIWAFIYLNSIWNSAWRAIVPSPFSAGRPARTLLNSIFRPSLLRAASGFSSIRAPLNTINSSDRSIPARRLVRGFGSFSGISSSRRAGDWRLTVFAILRRQAAFEGRGGASARAADLLSGAAKITIVRPCFYRTRFCFCARTASIPRRALAFCPFCRSRAAMRVCRRISTTARARAFWDDRGGLRKQNLNLRQ